MWSIKFSPLISALIIYALVVLLGGYQVQQNGINPGEILYVPFAYREEITAVQSAINADLLRIGIQVQGFATGGSDSLVTGKSSKTGRRDLASLFFEIRNVSAFVLIFWFFMKMVSISWQ